ncbi:MAG TPA: acylneuraminate cytidylyltransferase family protein [Kiritimatiellia bacterium]|nr:acylneuraminate cytidylyltransferase family protein [Kiritimatiellia bacterium]HMP34401.1 acylneuraminate cytidylyltransferase family protein [Kiritimatiellia bacterium]
MALITARGGSKGVPGKNIKPLAGKPLITHTIEAALGSRYVDQVMVSTDSEQIAGVARQAGAEVPFLRPAAFAGDLSKQEDAIIHAMEWAEQHGRRADWILILTPTNPLRTARHIDDVLEVFAPHQTAKAYITVMEASHPPEFMNTLPPDKCMKDFLREEIKWKNRQELPTSYQVSASICVAEWDYFKEQRSIYGPLTYAHVVDPVSGIDINTPMDFDYAEFLLLRSR